MKYNNQIQNEIAMILKGIGTQKCLAKAEVLEQAPVPMSELHLRDCGLEALNIEAILSCFNKEEASHLKSISFSYNRSFGDTGAMVLTKNLPQTICEIGLVNCGISDLGGVEILNWLNSLPNLRMICMEQNNFSEKLRSDFKNFGIKHPQIMIVY